MTKFSSIAWGTKFAWGGMKFVKTSATQAKMIGCGGKTYTFQGNTRVRVL